MEMSLIALAQQGDETAFAALFKQHRLKVYSRCLGMLRNPADAEDFTQEVFMKLHQTIGSFEGKSQFSTWLYKLTTNLVLMHLRSKKPDAASLDDMDREPVDTRAEVAGSVGVQEIIAHLPIRLRAVFHLRIIEGYSVNETAERLGCGPMAVVRRCGDAKELLRSKLSMKDLSPTPRTAERHAETLADLQEANERGFTHPEIAGSTRRNCVLSTLPLC